MDPDLESRKRSVPQDHCRDLARDSGLKQLV
jgi:hypothetical protein